jgi:hypothetical protein
MNAPTEIRPETSEYLPYYHRYVSLVPDGDILTTLERQLDSIAGMLNGVPEANAGYRYQPEKWSVRELIGHVCDTERVFAYRALRFGRHDSTSLPGFEQDDYVRGAQFDAIPLESLSGELHSVRKSTILLFRHFPSEAWTRRGIASGGEVSVRALAWMIAGHAMYHEEILRSRYGLGESDV